MHKYTLIQLDSGMNTTLVNLIHEWIQPNKFWFMNEYNLIHFKSTWFQLGLKIKSIKLYSILPNFKYKLIQEWIQPSLNTFSLIQSNVKVKRNHKLIANRPTELGSGLILDNNLWCHHTPGTLSCSFWQWIQRGPFRSTVL